MDKLIKKEVVKLYFSQGLFLLISIFCACVPLFSDSVSLTGYKALAGLFIFVNFPLIIRFFEHKRNLKTYFTNVIQLYLYIILPLVLCMFIYSEDLFIA